MTEHTTLEPTATVVCAGERANAADTTAAFVDLICADHELLRAEFDAIIAANLPDTADDEQRLAPANTAATVTAPLPPHRGRTLPVAHPERDSSARPRNLRARQRGPPARAPIPSIRRSETKSIRDRQEGGGRSIDTTLDSTRWVYGERSSADAGAQVPSATTRPTPARAKNR